MKASGWWSASACCWGFATFMQIGHGSIRDILPRLNATMGAAAAAYYCRRLESLCQLEPPTPE